MTVTNSLACVVLLRPVSAQDPSLLTDDGGRHIFPKLLGELKEQGVVSQVLISLSEDLPEDKKEMIANWGFPLVFSNKSQPQKRLADAFEAVHLSSALVLCAYSYLIDKTAVAEAAELIGRRQSDFAFTGDVISSKYFFVLNRRAVDVLARIDSHPIAPFHFREELRRYEDELQIHKIGGIESRGESFLWELFYAGSRAVVPKSSLVEFFSEQPKCEWFLRDSFKKMLLRVYGLKDWYFLDEFFHDQQRDALYACFPAQYHWIVSNRGHIPFGAERFLELGFGAAPVSSLILGQYFSHGVAVEPYPHARRSEAQVVEGVIELLALLRKNCPRLFSFTDAACAPSSFDASNVAAHHLHLSDLKLAENSIDFCFSKTVFEHVMDVPALSMELFRVLKPGGVMLHEIDFRDHRFMKSICFNFLEYSKAQWAEKDTVTNLWRINDFVKHWSDMGFKVEVAWREDTKILPPRIHSSWESYAEEDLLCHTALILARKS